MYETLVGAAGHQHDWIMYDCKSWQIRSLMRGWYRRHRPVYEANRMTAAMIAKFGGSKAQTFQDFMPFSWEKAEMERRYKKEREQGLELLDQMRKEMNLSD